MRVEMVFHSYIEVFDRLVSIRFDLTDWEFRLKRTRATNFLSVGPFHFGYTNQNIIHENLKDMLARIDEDFANYQIKENVDHSNDSLNDKPSILH